MLKKLVCLYTYAHVHYTFIQVRTKAEADIHQLNKRVLEAEVRMTDAKSEASTKAQSERILRRRFENLQTQLKEKDSLHEQRLQDIQVYYYCNTLTDAASYPRIEQNVTKTRRVCFQTCDMDDDLFPKISDPV